MNTQNKYNLSNYDANNNDFIDTDLNQLKKLQKSKDEIKESLYKIKEKDSLKKTISDLVSKELDKYKRQNEEEQNSRHYTNRNQSNNHSFINPQVVEENKVLNFELEHLRQENIVIKNDNIILREEVNRLNEIGVSLENELDFSRRKK